MTKSEKLAKVIRVITIPPALTLLLLMLLYFINENVINSSIELLLTILFLIVIPTLAYPVSHVVPRLKKTGRKGQRKLAFIFSLIGYSIAIIYGYFSDAGKELMVIYTTYFLSIILLIMFNKVLNIRASGHSCSITGPLILLVYYIGAVCIAPCLIIFTLIAWASLKLDRHTVTELVTGGSSAAIAFFLSLLTLYVL